MSRILKRTTANFLDGETDLDVAVRKAIDETNSDVAVTIQNHIIDEFRKLLQK